MNPITDFTIDSVSLVDTGTEVVFSFIKPTGDIGGYDLYISTNDILYEYLDSKIDSIHRRSIEDSTFDIDGRVTYTYTFSSDYDGKHLYCKIQAVSIAQETSTFSDALEVYTFPTRPTNLFVVYDGEYAALTWDVVPTDNGRNSTFDSYKIYKSPAAQLYGSTYNTDTHILYNDAFLIDTKVWVKDYLRKSWWYGEVETEGEFDLDSFKIVEVSDNSANYEINLDNLKVYIVGEPAELLATLRPSYSRWGYSRWSIEGDPQLTDFRWSGISSNLLYFDEITEFNINVFYTVTTNGLGTRESNSIGYPTTLIQIEESYPYLRTIGNSSTGFLNNAYWEDMKTCLIDSNYYDKTPFAIPYSQDELYNLKGYIGISNLYLDIFINDIYNTTVITDDYGSFSFDFQFGYETTKIKFQARSQDNISFSRTSANNTIKPKIIYSHYSALGEQYEEIEVEADYYYDDINIDTCRYEVFIDKFAPFVELTKFETETSTGFLDLSRTAFKAFEYAAFDKSLEDVLDKFVELVDEFDHYEIYDNNRLFQTKRSGYSFVPESPLLPRARYYYGVATKTLDGQETTVSSIEVDTRWWPIGSTGYVVLKWDPSPGADLYTIYRGYSETSTGLIITTPHTLWVDYGIYDPDFNSTPQEINFTDLEPPNNFICLLNTRVADFIMRQVQYNKMLIILYATGTDSIPEYQLTRIRQLCYKFIPPEIIYTIYHVNDTEVTIYTGGPVE